MAAGSVWRARCSRCRERLSMPSHGWIGSRCWSTKRRCPRFSSRCTIRALPGRKTHLPKTARPCGWERCAPPIPAPPQASTATRPPKRAPTLISPPMVPPDSPHIPTKTGIMRCEASTSTSRRRPRGESVPCDDLPAAIGLWARGRHSTFRFVAECSPRERYRACGCPIVTDQDGDIAGARCHVQQCSVDREEFHNSCRRLAERPGRMDDTATIPPDGALG